MLLQLYWEKKRYNRLKPYLLRNVYATLTWTLFPLSDDSLNISAIKQLMMSWFLKTCQKIAWPKNHLSTVLAWYKVVFNSTQSPIDFRTGKKVNLEFKFKIQCQEKL